MIWKGSLTLNVFNLFICSPSPLRLKYVASSAFVFVFVLGARVCVCVLCYNNNVLPPPLAAHNNSNKYYNRCSSNGKSLCTYATHAARIKPFYLSSFEPLLIPREDDNIIVLPVCARVICGIKIPIQFMFTLDSVSWCGGRLYAARCRFSESMGPNWINAHIVCQAHNQGGKPAGERKNCSAHNIGMANGERQCNGYLWVFKRITAVKRWVRADSSHNGLDVVFVRLLACANTHTSAAG